MKFLIQWHPFSESSRVLLAPQFPAWPHVEEALEWSLSRKPYRYDRIYHSSVRVWGYGPIQHQNGEWLDVEVNFEIRKGGGVVDIIAIRMVETTEGPINYLFPNKD